MSIINNTSSTSNFCRFDRPIKLRFYMGDNVPELWRTINIAKIERENSILALNMKLGSTEHCRCCVCNPDTTN